MSINKLKKSYGQAKSSQTYFEGKIFHYNMSRVLQATKSQKPMKTTTVVYFLISSHGGLFYRVTIAIGPGTGQRRVVIKFNINIERSKW